MVSIGITVEKYQQRNDCYYVAYTLFIYADGKRMTLTNRVLKWNYAYRPCAEIKVNKIPTEMLLSASSFKLDGGSNPQRIHSLKEMQLILNLSHSPEAAHDDALWWRQIVNSIETRSTNSCMTLYMVTTGQTKTETINCLSIYGPRDS